MEPVQSIVRYYRTYDPQFGDLTKSYFRFSICDADGNVVLKIKGPFCTMSICGSDVEFKVIVILVVYATIFPSQYHLFRF